MNRSIETVLLTTCVILPLTAGTITVGGPPPHGVGNCDPFGCPEFFTLGTYQQVFTSNAFSGIQNISQLTFQDTQVFNGGVSAGGIYTLSLSYTNAAPGALSTTSPTNNVTTGSEVFYSGTLPAVSGVLGDRLLVFSGAPFTYNPAFGDLLLTIDVFGAVDALPALYLDVSQGVNQTSSVYFGTDSINSPQNGPGLITQFLVSPETSGVPEPNSAWLMLCAAMLMGAMWRKRNKHH